MKRIALDALKALERGDLDEVQKQIHRMDRVIDVHERRIESLHAACEKMQQDNEKLVATANLLSNDTRILAEIRTKDRLAMQETTTKQNGELQKANERIQELVRERRLTRMFMRQLDPCVCCGKTHHGDDMEALRQLLPR